MIVSKETGRKSYRLLPKIKLVVLAIITLSATALAQGSREQVEGVKNFGRVTDRYFRGGQVTDVGVDRLARMGVRTIIDLRDKPSEGEPEACQRNSIKYFKFPMNGHVIPEDKAVNEILSIIEQAKEPVYVHCSAGKHRSGTIAALYRIRVQGWSKEQAWAEQQSYGFGPAGEHPELYAYVYGDSKGLSDASLARAFANSGDDDKKDEKSSKSKKDKDKKKDSDKDDDKDHKYSKKQKDHNDKEKDSERSDSDRADDETASAASKDTDSETAGRPDSNPVTGRLSADAGYIAVTDAIKRAKAEGATGDLLKIDLEWDDLRSVVTWDITYSSGTEYELDALTGKLLGTKPKAQAKLALLSPLELRGDGKKMFLEIIKKAEKSQGQSVVEMELKRTKARSQTIFEVSLTNGAMVYYDAATGEEIAVN